MNIASLSSYVEHRLEEMGLNKLIHKDSSGNFLALSSFDRNVAVFLGFNIVQEPYGGDPFKVASVKLDSLEKQILNSPLISNGLKKQIKELQENEEKLKAEVERLKQFEVHYNMQYKLQHGEKEQA